MKYNLRNYLDVFQCNTAIHPRRKVILSHASPQFRDAKFLLAAARELCPGRVVRLRQACDALSQFGFVGTTSTVDCNASHVIAGGCKTVTPSAFEVLARLVSFDLSEIPPGYTIDA